MSPTRRQSAGHELVVRTIADKGSGEFFDRSLDEYFLASRTLPGRSVASLLLASSFGVNAVFYAASLGYMMGGWALLIQVGWAASFFLLSSFASTVYGVTSLHDMLGRQFGRATRLAASVCSMIGLMYLVGWEISIGVSSIGSLAAPSLELFGVDARLLVGLAVLLAIGYSIIYGQRFNAKADLVLNVLKTASLVFIVVIIFAGALQQDLEHFWQMLFPPFTTAIASIGVLGFITSMLFNLSWQFVDISSWQSINSRVNHGAGEVRSTLRRSGIWMLFSIGLFGTLLGAFLRHLPDIDPNTILAAVTQGSLPALAHVATIAVLFLILLSVMSLVDGMVLSVAQTALVDVGVISRWVGAVKLWHARAATIVVGPLLRGE